MLLPLRLFSKEDQSAADDDSDTGGGGVDISSPADDGAVDDNGGGGDGGDIFSSEDDSAGNDGDGTASHNVPDVWKFRVPLLLLLLLLLLASCSFSHVSSASLIRRQRRLVGNSSIDSRSFCAAFSDTEEGSGMVGEAIVFSPSVSDDVEMVVRIINILLLRVIIEYLLPFKTRFKIYQINIFIQTVGLCVNSTMPRFRNTTVRLFSSAPNQPN